MEKLYAILVRIGILPCNHIYYIGGADILPPPLKGLEEQNALEELEQVESAKADHTTGTVEIVLNAAIDNKVIKKTIEEEGYKVLTIK